MQTPVRSGQGRCAVAQGKDAFHGADHRFFDEFAVDRGQSVRAGAVGGDDDFGFGHLGRGRVKHAVDAGQTGGMQGGFAGEAKGLGREREAAERAGADLFMAKPFSNAEFVAAVRRVVAR